MVICREIGALVVGFLMKNSNFVRNMYFREVRESGLRVKILKVSKNNERRKFCFTSRDNLC